MEEVAPVLKGQGDEGSFQMVVPPLWPLPRSCCSRSWEKYGVKHHLHAVMMHH